MLDLSEESVTPSIPIPQPMKFSLDMMDESPKHKKHKKHKKRGKGEKSSRSKPYGQEYAQLAFRYGVVCSRYDTLSQIVKLSIAAKRGHLNDQLLDDGLTALGEPRVISLPEV